MLIIGLMKIWWRGKMVQEKMFVKLKQKIKNPNGPLIEFNYWDIN